MANDLHVEWEDHARDALVTILSRDVAIDQLQPDTPNTLGPFVMIFSSGGGGAFATSGTREELLALLNRAVETVKIGTWSPSR